MEIIALVSVIATILSVEDNYARIDAGLVAGVRAGDIAEIYYMAPIGSEKKRVVVNRGEVVEVDELTALLEVEPEFTVMTGYTVEFEIPQNRISPLGVVELARSRLEARTTVAELTSLIDQLVPEDEFIEQQFIRLIEQRQARRQAGSRQAGTQQAGQGQAEQGQAEPRQAGPRQAEPRQAEPRQAEPRQAEQGQAGTQQAEPRQADEPESSSSFRYGEGYQEPEIVAMVQSWAESWSSQNVEGYLSFYSRDFQPPQGTRRAAWQSTRRIRLTRPHYIQLALVFQEARSIDVGRGWVEFEQTYRSDTFGDRVTKRLDLVWEGDDWKIVRESVLD